MATNGKFEKETPIGNLYGGYLKDYPLKLGGDNSMAWLGLGDYELHANKYDLPNQNPEYTVGMSLPDKLSPPGYYGELDTPLGLLFGGTNEQSPNVNLGFRPSDKAMAYVQALSNMLNRR